MTCFGALWRWILYLMCQQEKAAEGLNDVFITTVKLEENFIH